jgi:hypothetical protein
VEDFAAGVKQADHRRPKAVGSRTGRDYQAGIGPHTEAQTIRLVVNEMIRLDPSYAPHMFDVPYPGSGRQRCDWCLGLSPDWDWGLYAAMRGLRVLIRGVKTLSQSTPQWSSSRSR